MRISDWSSDVVSSDLSDLARGEPALGNRHGQRTGGGDHGFGQLDFGRALVFDAQNLAGEFWPPVFGDHLHLKRTDIDRSQGALPHLIAFGDSSEEHTTEIQSLMRISYGVIRLQKKRRKKVNRRMNTRTHKTQKMNKIRCM